MRSFCKGKHENPMAPNGIESPRQLIEIIRQFFVTLCSLRVSKDAHKVDLRLLL
jgi:hypothetical protein